MMAVQTGGRSSAVSSPLTVSALGSRCLPPPPPPPPPMSPPRSSEDIDVDDVPVSPASSVASPSSSSSGNGDGGLVMEHTHATLTVSVHAHAPSAAPPAPTPIGDNNDNNNNTSAPCSPLSPRSPPEAAAQRRPSLSLQQRCSSSPLPTMPVTIHVRRDEPEILVGSSSPVAGPRLSTTIRTGTASPNPSVASGPSPGPTPSPPPPPVSAGSSSSSPSPSPSSSSRAEGHLLQIPPAAGLPDPMRLTNFSIDAILKPDFGAVTPRTPPCRASGRPLDVVNLLGGGRSQYSPHGIDHLVHGHKFLQQRNNNHYQHQQQQQSHPPEHNQSGSKGHHHSHSNQSGFLPYQHHRHHHHHHHHHQHHPSLRHNNRPGGSVSPTTAATTPTHAGRFTFATPAGASSPPSGAAASVKSSAACSASSAISATVTVTSRHHPYLSVDSSSAAAGRTRSPGIASSCSSASSSSSSSSSCGPASPGGVSSVSGSSSRGSPGELSHKQTCLPQTTTPLHDSLVGTSLSSAAAGKGSKGGAPTPRPATAGDANTPVIDPKDPLVWPAWVYCTRYSDRPSSGPRARKLKVAKDKKPEEKRPRTAFTNDQLARLKKEFDENRYLTETRRQDLARELGLNESQIKIWFQNKRAKMKKATGVRNGLAIQLMAQGLYNHSTVPVNEDGHDSKTSESP